MVNYLFYQSRIVKGNNSIKELRAYSIATSWGSPAEVDVFRALPESPEKCDLCSLCNEYFGKLEITELYSTVSFFMYTNISSEVKENLVKNSNVIFYRSIYKHGYIENA